VREVETGVPAPRSIISLIVSGEPFPPQLKRRAVAVFGPCVIDCYGCTELGPLAYMPADELLLRPGSAGMPFPGVDLAAFDSEGRLGPGEIGLLRARTPLAFDGYLARSGGRPDSSGEGWATVGDMGFTDQDGYVYVTGRADDVVISGGVNVSPAQVESLLVEHPAIAQCAVVGLPDPEWGQVLCAVVVADCVLTLEEVRAWMRGRIADDKRPRRLVQLPSLPTTHTEKVSRRALREFVRTRPA
jgi:acyl-coenzyme A synthetase/AMP-(fatty) acid ligase